MAIKRSWVKKLHGWQKEILKKALEDFDRKNDRFKRATEAYERGDASSGYYYSEIRAEKNRAGDICEGIRIILGQSTVDELRWLIKE